MNAVRWRRTMGWALGAALVWLLGVWPPPSWWRHHWPTQTAMMRHESGSSGVSGPATYRPTALTAMPAVLQRMVIIGEDSRFHTHHGLDVDEIKDALGLEHAAGLATTVRALWSRRDRLRGASTITMQVAKNLFLWPGRSFVRKALEAPLALWIDLVLPKRRILEIYLNVAEWGPNGEFGVEAGARRAFNKPARSLNASEAALLAAVLPNPVRRSARQPGPAVRRIAGARQARAAAAPAIDPCVRVRQAP